MSRQINRLLTFMVTFAVAITLCSGQTTDNCLTKPMTVLQLSVPALYGTGMSATGNWHDVIKANESSTTHKVVQDVCAVDFNRSGTVGDDDEGTPILAVADGVVNDIGHSNGGYGNYVILLYDNSNGEKGRYAHLKWDPRIAPGIQPGASVRRGTVIGYLGKTGNISGMSAHLHYAHFHTLATGADEAVQWTQMDGQTLAIDGTVTSRNAVTAVGTISLHPNGMFIRPNGDTQQYASNKGIIFYMDNGTKRPFTSEEHYNSWRPMNAQEPVMVTDAELARIPDGTAMSFRPGTLLRLDSPSAVSTYYQVVVEQGETRKVGFPAWNQYLSLGYSDSMAMRIASTKASLVTSLPNSNALASWAPEFAVCTASAVLNPLSKGGRTAAMYEPQATSCGPTTLVATCTPNPAIILAGGTGSTLTGGQTGGTAPFSYAWSGVVTGSGSAVAYAPAATTAAGIYKATVKVTDSGSPVQTASADCSITVNAPAVVTSFNETFADGTYNAWSMVPSGSPVITPTVGDLTIRAGYNSSSGNAATFYSKAQLRGNMSATATFIKELNGRSWFGLYSIAKQSYPIMGLLDTNDWAYLDVYINNANAFRTGVSPYLNRQVKFGYTISGSTAQFLVDGVVVGSGSFDPTVCPCQLAFAVGSISWKNADNLTHFKSITATADSITGQLPASGTPTAPAPVLSTVDGSQMVGGQLTPVTATGSSFDAGVTLQFSGASSCANWSCTIPAGDVLSRTASTFSAKANLAAGTYSARAKNSDGQTSTNTISVTVQTAGPTTGTVSVSVSGYSGSIGCTIGGQSVTAPTSNVTVSAGSQTLSCTAPTGYTISYSPSATQTVTAGQNTSWTVTATAAPTTGTVNLTVSGYSGAVTCMLNGVSVGAPNSYTGKSAGNYTLSCTAPAGYNLSSISPSSTQNLSAGSSVTFALTFAEIPTSPLSGTCTVNSSTTAQVFQVGNTVAWNANVSGGKYPYSYSWNTLISGNFPGMTWAAVAGVYNLTVTVTDSSSPVKSLTLTCPQVTVNAVVPPNITGLNLPNPAPAKPSTFSIGVYGTAMGAGALPTFFGTTSCTGGCNQTSGLSVTADGTVMLISNVQLIAGSYYIKVQNPNGLWSNPSTSFVVK